MGTKTPFEWPFSKDKDAWQKSALYPPPSSSNWATWAWECIRRNSEYAQAYDRFKKCKDEGPLGNYPLMDKATLDGYYTHPPAELGESYEAYFARHSTVPTCVLTWNAYFSRVWFLKKPVDPAIGFSEGHIEFGKVSRRWRRNLPKDSSFKAEEHPIDVTTELAPGEILVRFRAVLDSEETINRIAGRVKKQLAHFQNFKPKSDYLEDLHLSLRLYDFSRAVGKWKMRHSDGKAQSQRSTN